LMKSEILIEISHLYKSFGELVAVNDVSLQIKAGEIYGLVGPDGAGKTTTMRLLCGAYTPSYLNENQVTKIRVGGYDVITQIEQARERIGYLPQRFSLYEELTVLENIRFFSETRGLKESDWKPKCLEILEFVGLIDFMDRRAGHLSGGMKQKLGLAAALVHGPSILLLDEPTTGVDPVTRQDFWQLIIRLVTANNRDERRTAVLISTPYMDEASRCTRIGFMHHARIAVEGTPAQLSSGLNGRILELIGSPLSILRKLAVMDEDIESVQMFGDNLHIRVKEGCSNQVQDRLKKTITAKGYRLSCLRVIPPQLEDVFIFMTETLHE
jgi:ABC-2 type transport system ATP-binding protein